MNTALRSRRNFWLAATGLGLIGALVSMAVFNMVYRDFPLGPSVFNLVPAILIAALTLLLLDKLQTWLDGRLPWTTGIARRFTVQIGVGALCAQVPALLVVFWHMISNAMAGPDGFLRLQDLLVLTAVSSTLVVLTVLLNLGLFLMQKWRESSLEAERYRKENVEFRFEMLRNQVNPHFLFNSLNTLAGLVYQDPDTASSFVRELARVYRYVLESGEKETTTLEQELNFLDAFLYLVKIRFAEGLDVQVHADPQALASQIPPLTLQLLVENAIKHNVVSASRPLKITIDGVGGMLTVSNTLQPKMVPEPGTHTGLTNIRNRYAFLTDRTVEIIKDETSFTIKLPLLAPDSYV